MENLDFEKRICELTNNYVINMQKTYMMPKATLKKL